MNKEQERFTREFVIGVGFLSGLWISVGINPETEIVNAFAKIIRELGSNLGLFFYFLPIIALVGSLFVAYSQGGKIGLIAIFFGFFGGLILLKIPLIGIALMIIAIIMGALAIE